MKNNDLSNELTKRVLVTIETLRVEDVKIEKVLGLIPVIKKEYHYDRSILSRFYLFADRSAYTLELVAFDLNNPELQEVIDELDELGTSPFRYYSAYRSPQHLVAELPYRPEVAGVIDVPSRQLMYGHWGLDFSRV